MEITEIFAPFLAEAAGGSNPTFMLAFYVLMFAGLWFLLIAPQRKKQKQHAQMIQALGKGTEVITAGGIYGTITNVKDDRFVLRISDDTKIEVSKGSIQTKVEKEEK